MNNKEQKSMSGRAPAFCDWGGGVEETLVLFMPKSCACYLIKVSFNCEVFVCVYRQVQFFNLLSDIACYKLLLIGQ